MTYTAHEVLGGVYEKTVKMTVDRRLAYMPYAQAGWREGTPKEFPTNTFFRHTLYSHSSKILRVSVNINNTTGKVVQIMVDTHNATAAVNCSRTTSRQVTYALRELGLTNDAITALKNYMDSTPHGVVVRRCGRDWVDDAAGKVVYAGGATV